MTTLPTPPPAVTGRLSGIIAEIADRLQSIITIANGYPFDFGSVNASAGAPKAFPLADITFLTETPAVNTLSSQGFDIARLEIIVVAVDPLKAFTNIHEVDNAYDVCIACMKTVIRWQQGYLPLSGSAVMVYRGFRKNISKIVNPNDPSTTPIMQPSVLRPTSMSLLCDVQYQSTEANSNGPGVISGGNGLYVWPDVISGGAG